MGTPSWHLLVLGRGFLIFGVAPLAFAGVLLVLDAGAGRGFGPGFPL